MKSDFINLDYESAMQPVWTATVLRNDSQRSNL